MYEYAAWLNKNITDPEERDYEVRNFDHWLKCCVSEDEAGIKKLIEAIEGRLRGAALGDAKYIEARTFFQKAAKESLERITQKTQANGPKTDG